MGAPPSFYVVQVGQSLSERRVSFSHQNGTNCAPHLQDRSLGLAEDVIIRVTVSGRMALLVLLRYCTRQQKFLLYRTMFAGRIGRRAQHSLCCTVPNNSINVPLAAPRIRPTLPRPPLTVARRSGGHAR